MDTSSILNKEKTRSENHHYINALISLIPQLPQLPYLPQFP